MYIVHVGAPPNKSNDPELYQAAHLSTDPFDLGIDSCGVKSKLNLSTESGAGERLNWVEGDVLANQSMLAAAKLQQNCSSQH